MTTSHDQILKEAPRRIPLLSSESCSLIAGTKNTYHNSALNQIIQRFDWKGIDSEKLKIKKDQWGRKLYYLKEAYGIMCEGQYFQEPVGELFNVQAELRFPYFLGDTLEAIIQKDLYPSASERATILLAVLAEIESIHESGIVHRDLNPRNILCHYNPVTDLYEIKIIDFEGAVPKSELSSNEGESVQLQMLSRYSVSSDYLDPSLQEALCAKEKITFEQLLSADRYQVAILVANLLADKKDYRAVSQGRRKKISDQRKSDKENNTKRLESRDFWREVSEIKLDFLYLPKIFPSDSLEQITKTGHEPVKKQLKNLVEAKDTEFEEVKIDLPHDEKRNFTVNHILQRISQVDAELHGNNTTIKLIRPITPRRGTYLKVKPEGTLLSAWMKSEEVFSFERRCQFVYALLEKLTEIHRKGWVLRNINANNIYVKFDGEEVQIQFSGLEYATPVNAKPYMSINGASNPADYSEDYPAVASVIEEILTPVLENFPAERKITEKLNALELESAECEIDASSGRLMMPKSMQNISRSMIMEIHFQRESYEELKEEKFNETADALMDCQQALSEFLKEVVTVAEKKVEKLNDQITKTDDTERCGFFVNTVELKRKRKNQWISVKDSADALNKAVDGKSLNELVADNGTIITKLGEIKAQLEVFKGHRGDFWPKSWQEKIERLIDWFRKCCNAFLEKPEKKLHSSTEIARRLDAKGSRVSYQFGLFKELVVKNAVVNSVVPSL